MRRPQLRWLDRDHQTKPVPSVRAREIYSFCREAPGQVVYRRSMSEQLCSKVERDPVIAAPHLASPVGAVALGDGPKVLAHLVREATARSCSDGGE